MNIKSNNPVRLEKKEPIWDKFCKNFVKLYPYLLCILIILIGILVFVLILVYFPPTESGQYYNRFGGAVLCLL